MTPIDLVAGMLAGLLFFGQFLLLLGAMGVITCVLIVFIVAEDIWRTIRIKRERRGNSYK